MSLTCMVRPIVRAIVLSLALAISATAQTTSAKLPDTAPGRLMSEWLAMCAAPKAEQFAKWDAEHYSDRIFKFMPADRLVKSDLEDCSDSGSYRVVEVTDSKPDQIDLQVVSNRTDVWFH